MQRQANLNKYNLFKHSNKFSLLNIELPEGFNRCPLCHENIEDLELGFKTHLMGDKPCPKNSRIKLGSKQVKIQI